MQFWEYSLCDVTKGAGARLVTTPQTRCWLRFVLVHLLSV